MEGAGVRVLSFLFAAGLCCLGMGASAVCNLTFSGGKIVFSEACDKLVEFDGITLVYKAHGHRFYRFDTASAVRDGYVVNCVPPANLPTEAEVPQVRGEFRLDGNELRVRFGIQGVTKESGIVPGLSLVGRRNCGGLRSKPCKGKCGVWRRHEHGGVPYEELVGLTLTYTNATHTIGYTFSPKYAETNPSWSNGYQQHVHFVRAKNEGDWKSEFRVVALAEGDSAWDHLLRQGGNGASVTFVPVRAYNWFESSERGGELEIGLIARDLKGSGSPLRLSWIVRDFDGMAVQKGGCEVGDGGAVRRNLVIRTPERRGLYFAEAVVTNAETGKEEAFSRTSLALLPPFKFTSTPENSIFGLSSYWAEPDHETVQRLMDRMGVRWVRNSKTQIQHPPRVAIHLSPVELKEGDPAKRRKWILGQLEECRKNGNTYWELGNELNMTTMGIAMKGGGIGKAAAAPAYCDWIRDVVKVRQECGYEDVKLLSFGLAGFDRAFVDRMHELGVWDLIDGVCLHPGRGNYAPDYPLHEPENYDGASGGDYWNYLGSIRGCQGTIRGFGSPKPLFLTEIYTPTFHNSWWEDTLRTAADNTVLSFALAQAEGVKVAFYYQLFDTVWYDRFGINPKEREYFFGLLNRDMSFKPAMMAYCAIAEALDGTKFTGWADPPGEKSHALLFDTPRGKLAVLWDRTDGLVLTKHKDGVPYASPEPWVDETGARIERMFPAEREVKVIDAIGREKIVKASGGRVRLTLTRSPIMVYGLKLNARSGRVGKTPDDVSVR